MASKIRFFFLFGRCDVLFGKTFDDLGFFFISIAVVFVLLIYPIVFLPIALTLADEDFTVNGTVLHCDVRQPAFLVVPFSVDIQHVNIISHDSSFPWNDGNTVGLFVPKSGGGGDFISGRDSDMGQTVLLKESAYVAGHFSLSRGSIISIKGKSSHSVHLMLLHRYDADPLKGASSISETYSKIHPFLMDSSTVSTINKLQNKSLYHEKGRSFDLSWKVDYTSQYSLVLGNDSPFDIEIEFLNVTTQSKSPLHGDQVGLCQSTNNSCYLEIPETYSDDYVSLVIFSKCTDEADLSYDLEFQTPFFSCLPAVLVSMIPLGVAALSILTGIFFYICNGIHTYVYNKDRKSHSIY